MIRLKKAGSVICALLVVYITLGWYSCPREFTGIGEFQEDPGVYFIPGSLMPVPFEGQKSTSTSHPLWDTVTHLPGVSVLKNRLADLPVLTLLRKIYVVNPQSFTTCKSYLFFPYHEFS